MTPALASETGNSSVGSWIVRSFIRRGCAILSSIWLLWLTCMLYWLIKPIRLFFATPKLSRDTVWLAVETIRALTPGASWKTTNERPSLYEGNKSGGVVDSDDGSCREGGWKENQRGCAVGLNAADAFRVDWPS